MTQPGPWGTSTDGLLHRPRGGLDLRLLHGQDLPGGRQQGLRQPALESTWGQNLSDDSNAANWIDYWTSAISPFKMGLSDGLRA